MIRTVLYLLISIFLITFLRYVIGMIGRGFSELFRAEGHGRGDPSARRAETAGELKKDPVCGTYVAAATSVKKTVRGEVIHFCSEACRDRYRED
jgi:YHS domain-containing protein